MIGIIGGMLILEEIKVKILFNTTTSYVINIPSDCVNAILYIKMTAPNTKPNYHFIKF